MIDTRRTSAEVEKLKQLPPLDQHVCATCRFLVRSREGTLFNKCEALSCYAGTAFRECKGNYWQAVPPKPPPSPKLPALVRFKRWLIG